jgi:hypothetical protein
MYVWRHGVCVARRVRQAGDAELVKLLLSSGRCNTNILNFDKASRQACPLGWGLGWGHGWGLGYGHEQPGCVHGSLACAPACCLLRGASGPAHSSPVAAAACARRPRLSTWRSKTGEPPCSSGSLPLHLPLALHNHPAHPPAYLPNTLSSLRHHYSARCAATVPHTSTNNKAIPNVPSLRSDEEIAELLLRAGASADQPNPDFKFPLHLAASRGKLSLLKLLLEVR